MRNHIKQFNFSVENTECVSVSSKILYSPKSRFKAKRDYYKDNYIMLAELAHKRLGSIFRAVVPVRHWIKKNKVSKKIMIADAITGTIYDIRSGRCMSSDSIKLKKIYRYNKDEAIQLLENARCLDDTITADN